MALQEHYNSSDSRDLAGVLNTNGFQYAQTFTPSKSHKISSVRLFLMADATSGTTYVMIKGTSAGQPTGASLTYAIINNSDLPASYGWVTIELPTYDLVSGTTYALCLGTGTFVSTVRWGAYSSGEYSGGNMWFSNNAGGSWSTSAPTDGYFEEYSKDEGGLFFCMG